MKKAGIFFVGGAVLLFAILGACWFGFGHIDRWALGSAVGVSSLLELYGVLLLVKRQRGRAPSRPEIALLRKLRPAQTPTMQLQFCKTSLLRLGDGRDPLLDALNERGHSCAVKECLNRCVDCKQGALMVNVDGLPLNAKDADGLLADLDELADTGR